MRGNAPMNTLKPQPGQSNSYNPQFHPLPGVWAQRQLNGSMESSRQTGSSTSSAPTEIQRALASERAQQNPRELQNTLLPSAKYGTEGRGYG